MKKVIAKSIALLLAIMTVCSLAACNGYVKQTGELDNLDEVPAVSGTIKFSYETNGQESKELAANAYIDAFIAKYPNAKVRTDYEYKTSMADQRISAGTIGDVFYFAELEAYNYAKTQGVLMPLDHYMKAFKINTDDIYSGIYAAGMIDGKYYYVARDFNQMIMTYNKDALAGGLTEYVKDGWTWETFLSVCEQATNEQFYGANIDLAYAPTFIPLLNAVGETDENGRVKTWYNTATRTVDFTSEGMLNAVQDLLDAYASGYINLNLGSNDAFADKKAVFTQHVYVQVESHAKTLEQDQFDWDMIHLPLTNNPMFGCGSSGVGVYNGTKNANTAAAFALFFYTQDGQTAFNGQDGGSVPVLASLKDADFWQHAEDDWSDKNWGANIYKSDEYAVIGQWKCILPSEVAELIDGQPLKQALQEVVGGAKLSDVMGELQEQCNQKWASLAEK
ncbi:MAG: hypothetical protein IKU26_06370 [Clostridia bacterium]|nr:hypothetical protein [Clostridia bacterium]